MAIDELTGQNKIYSSTNFVRMIKLPLRKQRIERWTNKNRSMSVTNDKALRSSTTLRTSTRPNRSEIALLQADRRLNMQLFQLGKQREKFIEQKNYEQKLFATKQALRHKDNQNINDTENFVRKCCKHSDLYDNDNHYDKNLEEHSKTKPTRSQSIAPIDTSPRTTKKMEMSHVKETDDNLHVQYRINTKNYSHSAHLSNKSLKQRSNRTVKSVNELRSYEICTIDSPSPILIMDHAKEQNKPSLKTKYKSSRTFITKSSLEKFRHHPERFLSKSNRYLPLLHHQTMKVESLEYQLKEQVEQSKSLPPASQLSTESSLTDDEHPSPSEHYDVKQPIIDSHTNATTTHDHNNINEIRKTNRINLMNSNIDENQERKLALSHFRDREYARLQTLIHSNRIERILTPFSSIKIIETNPELLIRRKEFSTSIQSLPLQRTKSINTYKQKPIDIDENLSKLNILVF